MTKLIEADYRLGAWAKAANLLLDEDDRSHQDLILHITTPQREHGYTEETFDTLEDMYDEVGEPRIHAVAEWIFPYSLYKSEGIDGVYDTYPQQLQAFQSMTRWGTYAHRLVERIDPETGDQYNPLERLIEKIAHSNSNDNLTYRSCYELGFHQGPFDIPLYDPASDRNRFFGGPCLSHVSFKLADGKVHLTAFYRSHEYRFKVPGNLLGLARLQECVANETDAGIGDLVVHSSRAFLSSKRGLREFRELVESLIDRIDTDTD